MTEYQNPGQYRVIQRYVSILEAAAKKILDNKITVKSVPIWGTVNMYQFSALILPPTRNVDNIILISSGLMTYALLMCKVLVNSLPIIFQNGKMQIIFEQDMIFSNMNKNPEIELKFIDLMLSFFYRRT